MRLQIRSIPPVIKRLMFPAFVAMESASRAAGKLWMGAAKKAT